MSQYKGLSVIIRTEEEYGKLQEFLGDLLYVDWVPQMGKVETAVVIHYSGNREYSTGSVGSSEYQIMAGIRVVEFNDFFKL